MYFLRGFISIMVMGFALFPTVAFMQSADPNDPYGFKTAAPAALERGVAGGSNVQTAVGNIIGVALSMIGIIFFLIIVYAGFNWMIARGNTEQVDKSKSMIEGAVIGLIIVMAAYAITRFVFESLDKGVTSAGGGSVTTLTCPVITGNERNTIDGGPISLPTVCSGQEVGEVCGASAFCAYHNEPQTGEPPHCDCT